MRDETDQEHRDPDAASYPESLTEEAATHPPLLRACGGGFSQRRFEGGAAPGRGIAEGGFQA